MATGKPDMGRGKERMVSSLDGTAALARELLPLMLGAGTVSLEGPLGAGKTHFVKATAAALGIAGEVTSPTFTLLHSYGTGEHALHHSDWYRLDSPAEAVALGLEEYVGEGLLMIEWGDKFPTILPPGTLRLRIQPAPGEARLFSW